MKKENTAIRLKKIMSDRNLRQVDILNMTVPYCQKYDVKMNKSDISQYCSGKTEPNQDKLFVLGMALNVSEAWLMGFDVPMNRTSQSKIDEKLNDIECDIDTLDQRVAYYTNYRKVLEILGYRLTTRWKNTKDGDSVDLLENEDFQIEVPHSIIKEKMNASKDFIEFQLKDLFKKYDLQPRNKQFDNMSDEEFEEYFSECELNAAHERTDIEITEEMKQNDDDIMNSDDF